MKQIKLCDDFYFNNIKFSKFHHTDCHSGCPVNYIAYMKIGRAKIVSDKKTIHINRGDIFYIPKGLKYQSYWYGCDDIDFLSFGFSNLHTSGNTRFELQVLPEHHNLKEKLFKIPTKDSDVDCKSLSLFYDAMAEAVKLLKPDVSGKNDIITQRATEYIKNNPYCSICDIARLCNISESRLYSAFKASANTTPNDYRQKVLCSLAAEMLMTTDKKIEEISSALGFSSSSYFRKIFKKSTGYTPREVRKNGYF